MKTFILLVIDFVAITKLSCTDALHTQPISSPCDIKTLADPHRARYASVCGFVFWWFQGAIMAAFSQSFYQRSLSLLLETSKWIRCQKSRRGLWARTEEMRSGASETKVTLWCKRCKEIWNLILIAQCHFNTQRTEIITIITCDLGMFFDVTRAWHQTCHFSFLNREVQNKEPRRKLGSQTRDLEAHPLISFFVDSVDNKRW